MESLSPWFFCEVCRKYIVGLYFLSYIGFLESKPIGKGLDILDNVVLIRAEFIEHFFCAFTPVFFLLRRSLREYASSSWFGGRHRLLNVFERDHKSSVRCR